LKILNFASLLELMAQHDWHLSRFHASASRGPVASPAISADAPYFPLSALLLLTTAAEDRDMLVELVWVVALGLDEV